MDISFIHIIIAILQNFENKCLFWPQHYQIDRYNHLNAKAVIQYI